MLNSLLIHGIRLEKEFISDFSSRMEAYYLVRDIDLLELSTRTILEMTLRSWGFNNIKQDMLSNVLSDMYAVTQGHWHPESDALNTLEALRRSGYRLSIISNAADDENTQVLVDKLGVRKYLDFVMSSAYAGVRKPNPEIFLKVLGLMDASPQQAVMVGDSLTADIAGGQNLGIFSIWINRHSGYPFKHPEVNPIIPNAVIDCLAELPHLLKELEEKYY